MIELAVAIAISNATTRQHIAQMLDESDAEIRANASAELTRVVDLDGDQAKVLEWLQRYFSEATARPLILISDLLKGPADPIDGFLTRECQKRFAKHALGTIAILQSRERQTDIDRTIVPDVTRDDLAHAMVMLLGRLEYLRAPVPQQAVEPQSMVIRPLRRNNEAEFRSYFRLRHRIYSQMGYLDDFAERSFSKLEMNEADVHSIHLGAYCRSGRHELLVGCARVVTMGEADPVLVDLFEIIAGLDPVAKQRLETPYPLGLPIFQTHTRMNRIIQEVFSKNQSCGELSHVIVDRAFRGSGISNRLISEALERAVGQGVTRIFLECLKIHEPLYEKHGFRRISGFEASVIDVKRTMIAMELQEEIILRAIALRGSHGGLDRPVGVMPAPPPARVGSEKHPLLNEGKLILVGRGEVGKTSLVKRLVENAFDVEEPKTQGIKITNWLLRGDADTLRLNIWDFGGQEIMHATHQFFLTVQSLYLLVLDGREGGEDVDAEYWLKHIESFGGESPVIVVQNKIAQHRFDLNYRGLQARYPQIRGFVKTDCKDQIGLAELRELIKSVIGNMPEVRMQFPADWFAVKQRLESMADEHLSYQRFTELCAEEGIVNEFDRDRLGFVLHCLGIALNYRDDSRLHETSILKPEWVTHGIYNILNDRKLGERQGELQLKELQEVLPKKRYPLDKHLFLVELMRKFSLCFPFHDEPDRYLIPELLGKEEPEEVATFQPEHCLNFEYHYAVLPEGLLPRFIVRTHTLSRGQQRWRSGVVLSYEDCEALIKAEPTERRVVVRVRGGERSARRNLLAIIRYDLERIHSEFKDRLDAQAKVPLAEFPAFSVDYKKLVAFESQGVKDFPEFIGQQVVTVHVSEMLNGVDFKEQRGDPREALSRAKSVFVSYSHKDEALRDELETHLKLLQRQQVISIWHDRKILPGDEWDREIDNRIDRANIILLLISADFIASEYCWQKEITRALERHAAKEATVVPLLLRQCDWKGAPFGKLQGLPKDMKAVTAWPDRDAAWTNVATGIRAIAERVPSTGFLGGAPPIMGGAPPIMGGAPPN